jgi:hypothetical protein
MLCLLPYQPSIQFFVIVTIYQLPMLMLSMSGPLLGYYSGSLLIFTLNFCSCS